MAMNNIELNILLEEDRWESYLKNYDAISNLVLSSTIDYVKDNEDIDFLEYDKKININLVLSNDTQVQELNREYRNKDKPTNVLSFANIDDESFDDDLENFPEIELGDIIISLETLEREADEKSITFQNHFSHLLIHGILHLLGFDHIENEDAEYMESFEIDILQQLNIANPYEELN